jgi:hypothetical protein
MNVNTNVTQVQMKNPPAGYPAETGTVQTDNTAFNSVLKQVLAAEKISESPNAEEITPYEADLRALTGFALSLAGEKPDGAKEVQDEIIETLLGYQANPPEYYAPPPQQDITGTDSMSAEASPGGIPEPATHGKPNASESTPGTKDDTAEDVYVQSEILQMQYVPGNPYAQNPPGTANTTGNAAPVTPGGLSATTPAVPGTETRIPNAAGGLTKMSADAIPVNTASPARYARTAAQANETAEKTALNGNTANPTHHTAATSANTSEISPLPETELNAPAFITELSVIVSENAEDTAAAMRVTQRVNNPAYITNSNPETSRVAENIFAKLNDVTAADNTGFTNTINRTDGNSPQQNYASDQQNLFAENELKRTLLNTGFAKPYKNDDAETEMRTALGLPDLKTELGLIRSFTAVKPLNPKPAEYVSGVTLEQISARIADYLEKLQTPHDAGKPYTTFTMRLNPESLGEITAEIVKDAENTAKITIIAQRETTAALLRGKAEQITRELASRGTIIESFTVSTPKTAHAQSDNTREYEPDHRQEQNQQNGQNQSRQQHSENHGNSRQNQTEQGFYGGFSFGELLADA